MGVKERVVLSVSVVLLGLCVAFCVRMALHPPHPVSMHGCKDFGPVRDEDGIRYRLYACPIVDTESEVQDDPAPRIRASI